MGLLDKRSSLSATSKWMYVQPYYHLVTSEIKSISEVFAGKGAKSSPENEVFSI